VTPTGPHVAVFMLLLASAACETGVSDSDLDGTWVGKTSQAGSATPRNVSSVGYFAFTVSGRQITHVAFTVSHDDSCGGMFGAVADVDAAIPADRSFELSNPPGSPPFAVTGTFASSNHAIGSLTAAHEGVTCASASTVRWTATK
jgi:hypothetical protein